MKNILNKISLKIKSYKKINAWFVLLLLTGLTVLGFNQTSLADVQTKKSSGQLIVPTNITVTPAVGAVKISWNAGTDSQYSNVKYTVVSSPSGLGCIIKNGSSCSIVDNVSTPYTFSVNASGAGLGATQYSLPSAALNPRTVLVVAGQSNASGYGSYGTDPITGINYLAAPYINGADQNDLITWLPWVVEQGNGATPVALDSPQIYGDPAVPIFGPEIGLARQLWNINSKPITIIKDAYGGTSLAYNWSPTGSGALPAGLYPAMIANVKSTMYNDSLNGQFDVLGGFYWYQGEADASVSVFANIYKKNLVNFIKSVRKDLPISQNAPFVIAKEDITYSLINNPSLSSAQVRAGFITNDTVRAAEDYAVNSLPNVYEVDGKSLYRAPSNTIHITNTSELTIGEEMANVSASHLP